MINRKKAFAYFDKNYGPLRVSTNGWYDGYCPDCGKPKLAVNFDFFQVKCWKGCFKGFMIDFIVEHEGVPYFEAYDLIEGYEERDLSWAGIEDEHEVSEIELPEGYKGILHGDTMLGERARRYLKGRGFDIDYMDRIGVGYCNQHASKRVDDFFGYIIIPFKRDGRLVYFIGRDYTNNDLRYKNPPKWKYNVGKGEVFFNEEALQLYSKVYLTEGWTDAATIGKRGVSIQGNTATNIQISRLIQSNVQTFVVVLDVGYYREALVLARALMGQKKMKVLKTDLLKEHGKDVNKIGSERILALEELVDPLNFGSLYKEMRSVS